MARTTFRDLRLAASFFALLTGCSVLGDFGAFEDEPAGPDGDGDSSSGGNSSGDGDGDTGGMSGDGDGDTGGMSGDGDGDSDTGGMTGDGDGDGDTGGMAGDGDGDGDGDTGGTPGDGDGDTGGSGTGGAASGGSDGSGGSGTGGDTISDAVPSNGCTVSNGVETITTGGQSVANGLPTSTRLTISAGTSSGEYIIDIPADYNPTHPYRLIFSWHQAYGSAEGNATGQYPAVSGPNFTAANYAFFGLRRESLAANDPAIFVAPQGIDNFPWNYDRDVVLFDNVLALVSENLCIDESRVFTTGFSFGAMMSHALSLGRASKLRGAVTMAPANYNFTQPTKEAANVAYFGITGMSDGTCAWVQNEGNETGGKYCVLTHAEDNGCTVPGDIDTTASSGSNSHVCYEFEGCAEAPVKVCTFDGAHTPSSVSNGTAGDDGLNAFVPPLAWDFISQL